MNGWRSISIDKDGGGETVWWLRCCHEAWDPVFGCPESTWMLGVLSGVPVIPVLKGGARAPQSMLAVRLAVWVSSSKSKIRRAREDDS